MLEAFALRGRALKLGYTRGPAEDGGWFHTYEKRFPTLGLAAIVEFTGNPLPEENRTVALIDLSLRPRRPRHRCAASRARRRARACCCPSAGNDLRLMAAEGTGFDPDWEKKSEY